MYMSITPESAGWKTYIPRQEARSAVELSEDNIVEVGKAFRENGYRTQINFDPTRGIDSLSVWALDKAHSDESTPSGYRETALFTATVGQMIIRRYRTGAGVPDDGRLGFTVEDRNWHRDWAEADTDQLSRLSGIVSQIERVLTKHGLLPDKS